jgi:hypothetical protein
MMTDTNEKEQRTANCLVLKKVYRLELTFSTQIPFTLLILLKLSFLLQFELY